MRSLAHLLSILAFVALVPAASMPKYQRRMFFDVNRHHPGRTYFTDVSQFDFAPFNITELRIFCDRLNRTVDYSCNLTFDWFDPNSVRQNRVTSGHCQTSWSWDGVTKYNETADGSGDIGVDWCWIDEDTYFRVAIPIFWQPGNFTIELAHHYRDDENFTIPWNYPTTFAQTNINIGDDQPLLDRIYHYEPGPLNGLVVGITD